MGPEVRPVIRWLILLGGLALVVTGTVATFVGRLALPAGIAIVVGAAGCLLAAIGRWPASLSGSASSFASSCSVSCFLPSLRISSAFSSTRMSSPLLITPIRSAISSASSI